MDKVTPKRLHEARDRDAAHQAYAAGREAQKRFAVTGAVIANPYLPITAHYRAFEQGVSDERDAP